MAEGTMDSDDEIRNCAIYLTIQRLREDRMLYREEANHKTKRLRKAESRIKLAKEEIWQSKKEVHDAHCIAVEVSLTLAKENKCIIDLEERIEKEVSYQNKVKDDFEELQNELARALKLAKDHEAKLTYYTHQRQEER